MTITGELKRMRDNSIGRLCAWIVGVAGLCLTIVALNSLNLGGRNNHTPFRATAAQTAQVALQGQ